MELQYLLCASRRRELCVPDFHHRVVRHQVFRGDAIIQTFMILDADSDSPSWPGDRSGLVPVDVGLFAFLLEVTFATYSVAPGAVHPRCPLVIAEPLCRALDEGVYPLARWAISRCGGRVRNTIGAATGAPASKSERTASLSLDCSSSDKSEGNRTSPSKVHGINSWSLHDGFPR